MDQEEKEQPEQEGESWQPAWQAELDSCPRCGEPIASILWGQTNCPRCGLHFECC